MHEVSKNRFSLAIFILPLLLSFLFTYFGFPIFARDDRNYLSEIYSRTYDTLTIDFVSWSLIKFIHSFFQDEVLAMRAIGLFTSLATIYSIRGKESYNPRIFLLVVSLFPLYWIIYFNQLRLGIALFLYLFLVTRGYPKAAVFGAASAHLSALAIPFPAAIIIVPFTLEAVYTLDPASFAAVRFAAYRNAEFFQMPWYFGWELIFIGAVFLSAKKYSYVISIIIYVIACRMIVDVISLDVGRRLIELGIFIYSPLNTFILTREIPIRAMLFCYGSLGILSAYEAFADGVLFFG